MNQERRRPGDRDNELRKKAISKIMISTEGLPGNPTDRDHAGNASRSSWPKPWKTDQ